MKVWLENGIQKHNRCGIADGIEGGIHAIFTRSLDMDILKGIGSNSCIELVNEGYIHALLYLKK